MIRDRGRRRREAFAGNAAIRERTMRLLFVKLKHIGDSLLLTPTLVAARAAYPSAVIWVVVRRGCEGILAGCPAIDRILTTAAPETHRRKIRDWADDWRLVRELRRARFDYVFELSDGDRGRWISRLSRAAHRCTNRGARPLSRFWQAQFDGISSLDSLHCHRVEKDFHTADDFLPLGRVIPQLCFAPEKSEPWPAAEGLKDFVVVHPATRWQRKQWAEENWVALGRQLLDHAAHLILSCGPDPVEIAAVNRLQQALGPRALGTGGALNWPQVAGLLYRAKLFVGVDTAAMHLAAACQCPTVAIFGPSIEMMWRPWDVPSRVLTARDFPLSPDDPAYFSRVPERRTGDVTLAEVWQACTEMLALPERQPPRGH